MKNALKSSKVGCILGENMLEFCSRVIKKLERKVTCDLVKSKVLTDCSYKYFFEQYVDYFYISHYISNKELAC